MDDEIPRTDDLAPRDIRRQVSGLLAQLSGSLADDFDVSLDGGLQILVLEETGKIDARSRPLNPRDAACDVFQVVGVAEFLGCHSGTASEYASLRIRGGKSAEGTISTGRPMRVDMS